jgi:hypothetical protein
MPTHKVRLGVHTMRYNASTYNEVQYRKALVKLPPLIPYTPTTTASGVSTGLTFL